MLQIETLLNLKETFDIEVTIDLVKGRILLHGNKDNRLHAAIYVYKVFREAHREHQRLENKLSDKVQWYFLDNSNGKDEWIEYPDDINVIIEKAYGNQDKQVKFMYAETEYAINFNNMEEYPTVDRSDVTTVIRREKFKGIYVLHYFLLSEMSLS